MKILVLNKLRTHNIAEYGVQFGKVNKLPFSDDNLEGFLTTR